MGQESWLNITAKSTLSSPVKNDLYNYILSIAMDNEDDFNQEFNDIEEEQAYEIHAPISLQSYPSDYSEPPALSYSYSGISNSSSSHDVNLHSSRMN